MLDSDRQPRRDHDEVAVQMSIASITISMLSLCIAVSAAWLTLLRRGRLAMTKPNIVFFGFDAVPKTTAKIFLCTLLYSTAVRGQAVE